MLKIESNKFISIFISALLIIALAIVRVLFVSSYKGNLEAGLSYSAIIAIMVYIFLFYCSLSLKKGLINVYSCLLLMAFLFYFGQHIVVLTGKAHVLKMYYRSILDGRVPDDYRISAGFLILIFMLVLNIGVLLGSCIKNKKRVATDNYSDDFEHYNKAIKVVAWIIFIIVLFPTLYKYYLDVINTLTYGYSEALEMSTGSSIQKVCYFLSYFFLPSIYLLLISYSDSKKKNIIILVYIVYVGLYLMTGSRFRVFESAVAILLIYNNRIKQITWRNLIKLLIIGVALLAVFSVVRDSREAIVYSDNIIDIVSRTWKKISDEGLFTNVLIETGSTFEIVDVVLYKTPSVVPYSYGYSIIGAFLMIFPSFMRGGFDINSVSTSFIYSPLYLNEIKIGMGSSFIAEAYHNFGIFSFVWVLIFGIAIGKMLTVFNNEYQTENNFDLYKYVYISSLFCFAIRTDLVSIPRYYVYYVLLIQLMIILIYNHRKSRSA